MNIINKYNFGSRLFWGFKTGKLPLCLGTMVCSGQGCEFFSIGDEVDGPFVAPVDTGSTFIGDDDESSDEVEGNQAWQAMYEFDFFDLADMLAGTTDESACISEACLEVALQPGVRAANLVHAQGQESFA